MAMLVMLMTVHAIAAQATQPAANLIHRTSADTGDTSTTQPSNLINPDIARVAWSLAAVLCLILVLRFLDPAVGSGPVPPWAAHRARHSCHQSMRISPPNSKCWFSRSGRRLLIVRRQRAQPPRLCENHRPR